MAARFGVTRSGFLHSARARLAVLSYHSWDTPPELVAEDVRALRRQGWRFVTAGEATEFLHGRPVAGERLALVTTDDAHATDAAFRDALRSESCPGVTFVPVGRICAERVQWLRETHGAEWSVQDHGPMHHRQFVSGHVTAIYHGQNVGELEHLALPIGAPLLVSAGELAAPRFDPHPEVVALCVEMARNEPKDVLATEQWLTHVRAALHKAKLAYGWRGRTHVLGTAESSAEFEQRVAREIIEGKALFERSIGHTPTLFAYPWWQGNAVADRIFAEAGYRATFAGAHRVQPEHHSPYSVPRVVMDSRTPRPLDLDAIHDRGRRDWGSVRRRVEAAAKRVMGVV
ncbi:MAG: polysaccharide deacetylase family protein [Gemmatimonadaceae bacterium]|nr:polysaccharide deacetylase family protein [Gemmatimonadaceae bacterium]NUR17931.1 polysaccharide deacetylase family protein [Gemmatimonadaceae bacterium]